MIVASIRTSYILCNFTCVKNDLTELSLSNRVVFPSLLFYILALITKGISCSRRSYSCNVYRSAVRVNGMTPKVKLRWMIGTTQALPPLALLLLILLLLLLLSSLTTRMHFNVITDTVISYVYTVPLEK